MKHPPAEPVEVGSAVDERYDLPVEVQVRRQRRRPDDGRQPLENQVRSAWTNGRYGLTVSWLAVEARQRVGER